MQRKVREGGHATADRVGRNSLAPGGRSGDRSHHDEHPAARFEVDLDALRAVPADLSNVSWSTRILVYRDAFMLASADGSISLAEEAHLSDFSNRMALPPSVTESVRAWVRDYESLLIVLEFLERLFDFGELHVKAQIARATHGVYLLGRTPAERRLGRFCPSASIA